MWREREREICLDNGVGVIFGVCVCVCVYLRRRKVWMGGMGRMGKYNKRFEAWYDACMHVDVYICIYGHGNQKERERERKNMWNGFLSTRFVVGK